MNADLSSVKGKKIIVGVTGGIAAYKVCTVVSRLAQASAEVTVLMTDSATRFIGPLTFQSLSGRPVYTSPWESQEAHDSQHIALARAADLMLIAPASTNTIAKLAAGICDNIVTLIASALPRQPQSERTAPVLLAPAMNAEMWHNPITQRNLATLKDVMGWRTVGPNEGWQACRTRGAGRMSEPEEILAALAAVFAK